jgi:hypothetical protein
LLHPAAKSRSEFYVLFTNLQIAERNLLFGDSRHIKLVFSNLRAAMSNRRDAALALDQTHCRAICDEIGARLYDILKKEASKTPPRLLTLLDQLAKAEEGPSIVPSLDDMLLPLGDGPSTPVKRSTDRMLPATSRKSIFADF